MARGIPLRTDYDADTLRSLARATDHAKQARRLLALSLLYEGSSRMKAADHASASVQAVRDWVVRFNAEGPEGLIDRKSPGTPPRLNAAQRDALAAAVEAGPIPCLDGVVRWRLSDLAAWLHDAFGVTLDETTVSRTLRDMGYRKLSARPRHHAQDPEAPAAFKKTSLPKWRKSVPVSPSTRR